MTGSKQNKNSKFSILNFSFKPKSGQVLLITVMLLATAVTVALSVSFKSTTETQVTKLQEESQKALAAAEAGIEAALKSGPVSIGGLSSDLSAFTGTADCVEITNKTNFVSPLIKNGGQYTFYLANKDLSSGWYTGYLYVYFKTETSNPAVELTFISSANEATRYLLDPDGVVEGTTGTTTMTTDKEFSGIKFYRVTSNPFYFSANPTKLIIARVLGENTSTRIAISGGSNFLPSQGKNCTSTATNTTTKVTKKVTLFQSHPQIPAEFFVTSF